MINLYLNEEERIVQLRKDTNLNNIERNFLLKEINGEGKFMFTANFIAPLEEHRVIRVVDNLRNEKIQGNGSMKQSFVYLTDHTNQEKIYSSLRYLQNEMSWDIIIYCRSYLCPFQGWIAPHRLIFFQQERAFQASEYKNLIDVIKEPNYDRYKFYQALKLEPEFFNETCLQNVNKIHIAMKYNQELYLPLALRIVKRENERRKQTNFTMNPLEIIFYSNHMSDTRSWDAILDNLQPKGQNVKLFGTWTRHPLYVRNNYWYNTKPNYSDYYVPGEFYFNILGGQLSSFDCEFFRGFISMQKVYRIEQSPRTDRCFDRVKVPMFEKPDELYGLINKFLCKHG
eukprot:TCONS_00026816-protein